MAGMTTSQAGIDLIKNYEHFESTAYLAEAGGIYTIGYGHRDPSVTPGMVITEAQAEEFLRQDLRDAEAIVNANTNVPLTQNQFDALVSLTFNAGVINPNDSVWREINAGNFDQAMIEFGSWRSADLGDGLGKIPRAGLIARRNDEVELFMAGDSIRDYNYTDYYENPELSPAFIKSAIIKGLNNGTVSVAA